MFGSALIALFVISISQAAWADGRCTPELEFEPSMCPLPLPPITRVTILENAAKSPHEPDPAVDCSRFVLTERLVRRYLSRAKRVPRGTGHSQLDSAPCSASGTVLFKNGQSARWDISMSRAGWLAFDGKDGETLYCPKCNDLPDRYR